MGGDGLQDERERRGKEHEEWHLESGVRWTYPGDSAAAAHLVQGRGVHIVVQSLGHGVVWVPLRSGLGAGH